MEARLVPAAGFRARTDPRRRHQESWHCNPHRQRMATITETAGQFRKFGGVEPVGCIQHGRLRCRSAGTGSAYEGRAGGRDGAERCPRRYQSLDLALGEARADRISKKPNVFSRRAARNLPGCRCAKSFSRFRRSRPETEFTVLITGGSQGSQRLNNAARESWPLFRQSESARPFHSSDRACHA